MKPGIINWSGIVLCSALLLPLAGSAGEQAAAAPVSNEAALRGLAGSFKINGRWTITVTNADRSVASRHQFNNALTPTGSQVFTTLIGRPTDVIPDRWQVRLRSRSRQTDPCGDSVGSHQPCLIWEVGELDVAGAPAHVSTLRVGPSAVGSPSLVLQGSIKTAFAGAIDDVATTLFERDPRGNGIDVYEFTQHFLSTPVVVQAGQTIDVKVVITMS